jgi:hypothetical protein
MLESVLSLLVEEVKELRHATQQLRDEHMLLANEVAALQQRQMERDNDRERSVHPGSANMSPSSDTSSPFGAPNSAFTSTSSAYISRVGARNQPMLTRHDMDGSTSTSTNVSPPMSNNSFASPVVVTQPTSTSTSYQSSQPTSTSSSGGSSTIMRGGYNPPVPFASTASSVSRPTAYVRREIINYLPFLSKYPISSLDAPFAIDDLSRPFAAVRRVSGVPGEWEYSPPIFVFANDAFCSMVKYPLVRRRPLLARLCSSRAHTCRLTFGSSERTARLPVIQGDVPR